MQNQPYKLSDPDSISILPGVLKEISGITERDDTSIVCIEDDNEIIYIYDINKNKITWQLEVGGSGDFEGVARVDRTLYILRSDGLLSEIIDYESDKYSRTTYETGIPWKDNEGLCYDRRNNRLLIGPKEIPGKHSEIRGLRFIYGFNLDSKELEKEPVFRFDLSEIEKFAQENNIEVPIRKKNNIPGIKFSISALGIHPLTGRLYVLSARDKLLFIFDMDGKIESIDRLNPDIFWQPEGITFMRNGDMFISNEGKKKKQKPPTLLRFNYRPAK